MCFWIVPPSCYLWKIPDSMNLALVYSTWNYYFVALSTLICRHQSSSFHCGHLLVSLIVVSYPNHLFIGNAKVYANNRISSSTL